MESKPSYEQLIMEGMKDLPQELLAEIADFVYFVRKRFTHPQTFADELETTLLETETAQNLDTLSQVETSRKDEADEAWLKLAGTISQDDLRLMTEAIETGCERIDLNEW